MASNIPVLVFPPFPPPPPGRGKQPKKNILLPSYMHRSRLVAFLGNIVTAFDIVFDAVLVYAVYKRFRV